jgi:hypothetical protein
MNRIQIHVETNQAVVRQVNYAQLPHTTRLRAKPELKPMLLQHSTYKLRDVTDLFHEARKYTLGRIPIGDREACIAILLSRDERDNGSPVKLETLETLTVATVRKFR